MKKESGSALVEYTLPLALFVVIAGLAILGLYNSGLITNLFTASSNSKIDSTTRNATANAKATPYVDLTSKAGIGGFGAPLTDCQNGVCSIDFGGYILRGVPENFSDLSTASKGVELSRKYYMLLDALAAQAKENGVPDWALIQQAANKAKKIADLEDRMNDTLSAINKFKTNILDETGGKYKKMKAFLNKIDTTTLTKKDINKMLTAANYAFESGLTDQDQLDKTTKLLIVIKKDFPNLKPWEVNFVNAYVNTPAKAITRINTALSYLTDDDNTMILTEGSDLYNKITERMDDRLNWISSTGSAGPGQNLKDIVVNQLPSSGLPSEMKKLVAEMSNQVMNIADSFQTTESSIGIGNYKQINLTIQDTGTIQKDVTQNLIDAVTQQ